MQTLLEALTYHRDTDSPTSVVVILVVRATLVLATGCLASRLAARQSAAVAHRLWLLALVGSLVVPVVWALTPGWRLPLVRVLVPSDVWCSSVSTTPAASTTWPVLLIALWIVGAAMGLGYTLLGLVSARRLFRSSLLCDDAEWLELVEHVRQELRIARPVELRVTRRAFSPAVWCFGRVRILLPSASLDWPYRQRRSVLMHELAHVARQDCWWQLIARVACAVWWFHPLAWLAAGRLRSAAEVAADDFVIRSGGGRVDYAQQLLAIAGSLGWSRRLAAAQTMFHPSHLERRVRAILDPGRPRAALAGHQSLASFVLAAALVVPLATLTPSVIQTVPPPAPRPAQPVRVRMQFNLHVPSRSVPPQPRASQPGPAAGPVEVRTMLREQQPAQGFPPVTTQLIPNWEIGQRADQLIPNYAPGMAQVVPVHARDPRPAAREVAGVLAPGGEGLADQARP